jgi:hypothetical protein
LQAIGHREFDLKLTDRVKMKMVGVPESSFDFWAAKVRFVLPLLPYFSPLTSSFNLTTQFLAQGYKVGRVDQCETALGAEIRNKDDKAAGGKGKGQAKSAGTQKNGKEIVRRELKSVLTGGTIVEGEMLTDDMSNHCVAIKVRLSIPLSHASPSSRKRQGDADVASGPRTYRKTPLLRTHLLPSVSASSTPQLPSSNSPISPTTPAAPNSKPSSVNSSRRRSSTRRAIFPSRP